MPSKRTIILVLSAAALAVATVEAALTSRVGSALTAAHAAKTAAPPPPQVDVAAVIVRNVIDWKGYSGRLEAVDRVEVRSLVPGTITAVHFKDGGLVKKGDPLYLIDPRPYVAALDRATAQVAVARARFSFASSEYARAQRLIATNAIAKRDFDEKANASLATAADVKAAEAAVATAQVDLGYTRIIAPVSGRMSRSEMTIGNVVSAGAGAAPLTTLVSVSPIYANFDMDERTYLAYLDGRSTSAVPVRLGLANDRGYAREGKIASVDNQLDARSGTIRVRATFDNADGTLLPGLFARIIVGEANAHPAVLIDERAIATDQAKKFVLVIDDKSRAQYREVKLGGMFDGYRIVTDGLSPHDRIVVSGSQRVHSGDVVGTIEVPMSGEGALASN